MDTWTRWLAVYPRITTTITGSFIKKCPGCGCVTTAGPRMCFGCEERKNRKTKERQ